MVDGEDKTRIQGVADSIIKYTKDISCDKNVYQAKMDWLHAENVSVLFFQKFGNTYHQDFQKIQLG